MPVVARDFFTPVQTGPSAYPVFSTVGTDTLPPGRGVDHPRHLAARLGASRAKTVIECYRETFTFNDLV
jgi:hypothetical protein